MKRLLKHYAYIQYIKFRSTFYEPIAHFLWFIGSLFLILLACRIGYCSNNEIQYGEFGIAVDSPKSGSYSEQKLVEIGIQTHERVLEWSVGIGGWSDGSHYPGVKDSLYGQILWGVEPRSNHFYVHYLFGPAIISSPDTMLASNFQFAHELGFGFKDWRDVRVGVAVKHYSNAGIVHPNIGRQFLVLEAAFK